MVRRSKRLRDQVKKAENESSKEEEKNVEPPRKKRKVDPEAKAKKEKKAKTDFVSTVFFCLQKVFVLENSSLLFFEQKRKKRALKQKLYLISRTESEEEATYVVLGTIFDCPFFFFFCVPK
jgi:predicted ATP-dependent protease